MSSQQAIQPGGSESGSAPDAVLRALADPHRRRILKLVRSNALAAGQIATQFDITQQAVSQHLRVLERAGLLSERREGTRRLYAFRPESLEAVRGVLADLWPDALERLKHAVERGKRQKERKTTS
ncbi:MAG: regulatory protein ArsR [Candidatus Eremiobacteraeota bacterium]|jgi:DNA-binding transcriptional ArsR family regulator|nr:regulatory protein ArsR [Candidatus Eremiobacteraeota bacterium]